MLRHAAQNEEIGQDVDDVGGVELAIDADRQRLMRELVDHVEHAILPSLMGSVLDEVVGPDMVGPLGAQPDARSVIEPKPASPGLFGWNLQPLLPPDALDPLVVDHPARLAAQKLGDLAIAVAAIAAGQCNNVVGQLLLIVPAARNAALRGAMLPQSTIYPALRHALWQS